jgi:flagellar biosynthesis GTPase FlhF
MHVRKFEGDTLDEVLKEVKRELGPDAIILKTLTNSGLRGAFKKKKIEITAAVKDEDYLKKAQVDRVLSQDDQESFYQNPASAMKRTIDDFSGQKQDFKTDSYSQVSLNRSPITAKSPSPMTNSRSQQIERPGKSSLDDFLGGESTPGRSVEGQQSWGEQDHIPAPIRSAREEVPRKEIINNLYSNEELVLPLEQKIKDLSGQQSQQIAEIKQALEIQNQIILKYEREIENLKSEISRFDPDVREDALLRDLKNTLRVLDINEKIIQLIVKDLKEYLAHSENITEDELYSSAVDKLKNYLKIGSLTKKRADLPEVILCSSEVSSGLSTFCLKLVSQTPGSVLIKYTKDPHLQQSDLTSKMLGIEVRIVDSVETLITEVRKSFDAGDSVVVDFHFRQGKIDDFAYLYNSLKKGFINFSSLYCLSLIHSELYNRSVLKRYKDYYNGLVFSHAEMAINPGSLFNLQFFNPEKSIYYLSCGPSVPDDLKEASVETIIDILLK